MTTRSKFQETEQTYTVLQHVKRTAFRTDCDTFVAFVAAS